MKKLCISIAAILLLFCGHAFAASLSGVTDNAIAINPNTAATVTSNISGATWLVQPISNCYFNVWGNTATTSSRKLYGGKVYELRMDRGQFSILGTATENITILLRKSTDGRDLIGGIESPTIMGLGDMSLQSSNNVTISGGSITGITDLAVADGGTGASTLTGLVKGNGTSAFTAITDSSSNWDTAYTDRLKWDGGATGLTAATGRTSLGLGDMALQSSNNVTISGGTVRGSTVGGTTVTANQIILPSTASSTVGVFYQNSLRIHSFGTGADNIFMGFTAGNFTNATIGSVGIGNNALMTLTTGNYNCAIGTNALELVTFGAGNMAMGLNSLVATTTGSNNVAIGLNAGQTNISGANNTFIGKDSDASAGTLTNATAIGYNARVGASNSMVLGNGVNVGIGTSTPNTLLEVAGLTSANVFNLPLSDDATHGIISLAGTRFFHAHGVANIFWGENAGKINTTGEENSGFGFNSLQSVAGGSQNTAMGAYSLYIVNSGEEDSAFGDGALSAVTSGIKNTAVGSSSGTSITTGNHNTFLGAYANSVGNLSNATAIGAFTTVGASNSLVLGNNANVGIQTSTPRTTLDVSGNIYALGVSVNGTTTTNALVINGPFSLSTGAVTANVYTPSLTNVANLDASTAYECQWLRIGNVVTVSGKVSIDPTLTATSTQLGISLPVASNIGAQEDVGGTAAASGIVAQCAAILGDATNDRAQLQFISTDTTNQPMYFSFTYQVI